MDQSTASILAAIVGSGGASGALVQYIGLRREKASQKKWRADMEARLSKVESQSPTALLKRLEEAELQRAEDQRVLYTAIGKLRRALSDGLEVLGKVADRLGIPAV
jgi:hypothetical protein